MKLTRGSVLSAGGIALVIGLFAWAWVATDRHHSGPGHMDHAVQQMHAGMQNGAMPMSAMRMNEMDMAAMHEAMLDDGPSMMQMPLTPAHIRHMGSMGMEAAGMRAVDDVNVDHEQHHSQGR